MVFPPGQRPMTQDANRSIAIDTKAQRELGLFLLFAFVVLALGIGLRAPWPADEPRFVLVAKQMWESGDWLFPHRGRELYADKPPVYFWLLNACYAVVRNWNLAFLLPSLFSALGTLVLVADLGRRLWTPRIGVWAAALVLCSMQFVYQAKRAQIDPTLVFLMTLGCYGLLRHMLVATNWRWFWFGCFASGLAVATKGVGFLVLFLVPAHAAFRGRAWNGLRHAETAQPGRWLVGALTFLAGIGVWFVPMLASALAGQDPAHRAYLDELLFRQTATRYIDAWHHHQPAWYFLEVVALFWLPFSLVLPWLFKPWLEAWRARDARIGLLLVWVVLVFVFFSASPGKRDMYVLPALPLLALAAAPHLPRLLQRRDVRGVLLAFVLVIGTVFLAAGLVAVVGDPAFERKLESARGLADVAGVDRLWWSVLAMGAGILLVAAWCRTRHVVHSVVATVLLLWAGYSVGIVPVLDAESSGERLMRQVRTHVGDEATVGMIGWTEQMLLQARGPTTEFGFKARLDAQWNEGLLWLRAEPERRRLLVDVRNLPRCVIAAAPVGSARDDWRIVDQATSAACSTPLAASEFNDPAKVVR